MVTFEVPGKPKGKDRPRRGKGKTMYTPKATVEYEDLVRWAFTGAYDGETWFDNEPLTVSIIAYYQPNKKTTKVERQRLAMGVLFPVKKPDADNIAKIICDALNEVAYRDDAQVVNLRVMKRYTTDEPRVVVTIKEVKE